MLRTSLPTFCKDEHVRKVHQGDVHADTIFFGDLAAMNTLTCRNADEK